MSNSFRNQEEGLQAVLRAACVISQMFSQTIGPYGFRAIVHHTQNIQTTRDSRRMFKDIVFLDAFENIGIKLIRDTALQTRSQFGDGAKTTTLLIEALLEKGITGFQQGCDPQELYRGMLLAEQEMQKILHRKKFPVTDLEHLVCVSDIAQSVNTDLASVLSEAVRYAGKDGYYILEENEGNRTTWSAEEYAVWDFGYTSPYFITHAETETVEYSQVYVLVSESPLPTSDQCFFAFLEAIVQGGKTPLMIIAKSFDRRLLSTLEMNQIEGRFPVCAIRVGGKHAQESLEDIAALTGASLLTEEAFKETSEEKVMSQLGFVKGVCISATNFCIPREGTNKAKLAAHCSILRDELDRLCSEEARTWQKKRLARLSTGEVRIRVAAELVHQEELAYIAASVRAMTESLRGGCLPGGGCSLIRAAREVSVPITLSLGERFGFLAVLSAAERPFRAIVARSGKNVDAIFSEVFSQADWCIGFNGLSGCVEDIVAQGICDEAFCIQNAIHHAVRTVGLLLTSALFFASQEGSPSGIESSEE